MQKSYTTEAINLKNYPLNDNDSIVVMFSKTKGLLRAVAKNTKKPTSKLGARIQMFVANTLMLNSGKNLDTITQAQSLNTFSKIRYDLDKLSYSMYIIELINNFCSSNFNQDENYEEIYNLIFNTFEKISSSKNKKDIIFNALKFQIKIINLMGYGLDFTTCSICQNKIQKDAVFSNSENIIMCEDCAKKNYDILNVKLNYKIKEFLSILSNTNYNSKTKYDDLVNETIAEKCFLFIKKYIDNITNKKTKIFKVLEQTMAIK